LYGLSASLSRNYLTCIDFNGEEKWQLAYGKAWNQSFPNTRSTPTIEGDRIYIISGIGELVCLNAETGDLNWKINVDKEYQAPTDSVLMHRPS